MGIARHGCRRREARAAVVAVDKVGQPRQPAGGCHQRVQPASGQRCVNAQLACVLPVVRQRVGVGLAGQAAGGFGFDQQFLAKVFQFAPGVPGVESDHVGQRFHRRIRRVGGQIKGQIDFQLRQQHREFSFGIVGGVWNFGDIDQNCALRDKHPERSHCERSNLVALRCKLAAHHANAFALQGVGIKRFQKICFTLVGGRCRCVLRVGACHCIQQRCSIPNRARHGTGGVLRMRNRNDTRTADQAQCRFDAHQTGH